jgi:hypothetical protein
LSHLSLVAAILTTSTTAFAFSSYESGLQNSKTARVGLIATVTSENETKRDKALAALSDKKTVRTLKKQDITNVSIYKKR